MERALLILLSLHLLGHLSQAQEDEVIFISGGYPFPTGTSTEVLDISSSSSPCSRTTGDLPESRYKHSMDKMGDAILICGGGDDSTWSRSTSCVSSRNASGPWLHHSTTNSGRQGHSSAITDGRLHLLAGGYSGSWGGGTDTMERFYEGVWTEQRLTTSYSIGPGSCSVQTRHDTFIVTGGDRSNRKTWRSGIWDSGTWRWVDNMKVGRQFHACGTIVIGDKVFLVVAGGVDSDYNIIQSSEVWNGRKWQDMGDLVKGRVGAKIVTVRVGGSQKMIIMGGNDDNINGNNLNSVEELVLNATNVGQSTWQLSEATIKKARSGFGAVSVPKSTFCDN